MSFEDIFYSPETKGDLLEYLKKTDFGSSYDNLFLGPEYFFVICDKGFINPGHSLIRVDNSPAPDIVYFVNSDFNLESNGYWESNMSAMGAKKGIYNPNKALEDKAWSISHLKI